MSLSWHYYCMVWWENVGSHGEKKTVMSGMWGVEVIYIRQRLARKHKMHTCASDDTCMLYMHVHWHAGYMVHLDIVCAPALQQIP